MKIPIEALELARFACTGDPSRDNLSWLQFQFRPVVGMATATTTDGHRLGRWKWLPTEDMPDTDRDLYLRAAEVAEFVRRSPKKARLEGADLVVPAENGAKATLEIGGAIGTVEHSLTIVYPDTDQVIPPREKGTLPPGTYDRVIRVGQVIGLDFRYLADILAWAKACDCGPEMPFQVVDDLSPVRIDVENETRTGEGIFLIMPARL